MPEVHSKLSPSAASRWLACPGSLFIGDAKDEASEYAAEGTVAHSVAARCYLLGVGPETYLGSNFEADGYSFTVDQEMVDSVKIYLDYIDGFIHAIDIEQRIEHSEIEGFGGTVDCVASGQIVDFKYGAGVAVEAVENEQLGCYALLFLDKFNNGRLMDMDLTIVQPRAHHDEGPIRNWLAPKEWLEDLKERIMSVAIGERNDEIHAGDHCRWCPHKAQCPELYEMTLLTAKREFSAPQMTPEIAAEILSKRKSIETFLDAVTEWAHGQLDKGLEIPGYKLVEKLKNRQYKFDDATVEKRCKSKGFGKKQIYKTELLSPAQLEKVVGKELIASLVERPSDGTTVVPISDKRPAVQRLTAADEFANVDLQIEETVS